MCSIKNNLHGRLIYELAIWFQLSSFYMLGFGLLLENRILPEVYVVVNVFQLTLPWWWAILYDDLTFIRDGVSHCI